MDIIRAKNNAMPKPLFSNSVISTWHLLSKYSDPMMKNLLILGYFEVGLFKICSTQELFSGSKTHFCLKMLKFMVWIFEICPGVDFMKI